MPRTRPARAHAVAVLASVLLLGVLTGTVPSVAAPGTPEPSPTGSASPATPESGPESNQTSGPSTDPSATSATSAPGATPDDPSDSPDQQPLPLTVTLESLQPSVVPRPGRDLTVAGRVTNTTTSTWTGLQAFLAVDPTPLTTAAELEAAQRVPVGLELGLARLVETGLYVELDDLDPGESVPFSLTVPRGRLGLPDTSGVYRVGVHVLGEETGVGRLDGADGRARTFLAQLPRRLARGQQPTQVALVLPIRARTVRRVGGQLAFPGRWRATLATDGRLGRLVGLSGTTAGFPLTWMLDPAVVEAAGSIADSDPELELGQPAFDHVDDVTGSAAVTGPTDGGSPTPVPSATPGVEEADPGAAAEAEGDRAAEAWLDELRRQSPRHPIFALPYGDLDVAAAARAGGATIVTRALDVGTDTLRAYGIEARRIVSPPDPVLRGWMLDRAPDDAIALLRRGALPAETAPVVRFRDRPVVLFDAAVLAAGTDVAAESGLDLTDRSALGVRQRLLSLTAVRTLAGDDRPLVAVLPNRWDPGPAWERSAFFAGLDVPWLSATGLADVAASLPPAPASTSGTAADDEPELVYGPAQRREEIPLTLVRHAGRVGEAGRHLDDMLVDDRSTGPRVLRQALLGASFANRGRVEPADARLDGLRDQVDSWVRAIRIAAPSFVVSSSEEGSFLVPVVNGLDQRVRVGLRARVRGTGLEVTGPGAVVLAADSRRPFKMRVRSTGIGVRQVDLDLVTADGERLATGPTVSVRSSNVGLVVWVVMGVAAAVFFSAIALRLVRRARRRRRTHGPVLRRAAR